MILWKISIDFMEIFYIDFDVGRDRERERERWDVGRTAPKRKKGGIMLQGSCMAAVFKPRLQVGQDVGRTAPRRKKGGNHVSMLVHGSRLQAKLPGFKPSCQEL